MALITSEVYENSDILYYQATSNIIPVFDVDNAPILDSVYYSIDNDTLHKLSSKISIIDNDPIEPQFIRQPQDYQQFIDDCIHPDMETQQSQPIIKKITNKIFGSVGNFLLEGVSIIRGYSCL